MTHIENAKLQHNPIYGAAVLRELERMKTKDRPENESPEQFAQSLVGERYKQLVSAARMVRQNHKLMTERNANFVLSRKDSSLSKIARGLEVEKARLAEQRQANNAKGTE